MAYGRGFLANAIMFDDGRAITPRNTFCAPASDDKRVIYQGLVDEFEQGEKADKSLVRAVMVGVTPDCSYFIDVETGRAPKNPQEVRGPRG